jgi:Flp pilus assembly protein TadD
MYAEGARCVFSREKIGDRRGNRVYWDIPMHQRLLPVVVLLSLIAAPAFADARSDAKAQVEFGISMAQRGLWTEAIYRWERAAQLDPTYAAAFNNLAVAYEHEGKLDQAAEAYERALKLEPNNPQVRQNFELFKEIHDRTNQSQNP